MTTITPEQFMTMAEPDEDLEGDTVAARLGDPLEYIAGALERIEVRLESTDYDEGLADSVRQDLLDLEAKHAELYALLEEIEAIIKPSTSKLANSLRDAIKAWRDPEVPTVVEIAPDGTLSDPITSQPAHDADVEEWREYARSLGYRPGLSNVDVDQLNRSQIRTLLGIEQPAGAES